MTAKKSPQTDVAPYEAPFEHVSYLLAQAGEPDPEVVGVEPALSLSLDPNTGRPSGDNKSQED